MACMIDFRRLDEGLGGQKNKRKRPDELPSSITPAGDGPESMDVDADAASSLPPPAKRAAVSSQDDPNKPTALGRPTYDGVIAGRVSGRKWKQVRPQRASAKQVTRTGSTHEQRAREREIKRAFRERMGELKEEIRKNKQEKREKREEREKRKKENELRSGMRLQVITNPKTLKKIAKSKQKKLLKVVPDEVVSRNKGKGGKK